MKGELCREAKYASGPTLSFCQQAALSSWDAAKQRVKMTTRPPLFVPQKLVLRLIMSLKLKIPFSNLFTDGLSLHKAL